MPKIKSGEKITWKEWFKRWGDGIKNLTPMQKISNERNAALISLLGFITCLVALIIFRDKLIVNWFAYGLILVFVGNTWTTGLKFLSLNQQLKQLKQYLEGAEDE